MAEQFRRYHPQKDRKTDGHTDGRMNGHSDSNITPIPQQGECKNPSKIPVDTIPTGKNPSGQNPMDRIPAENILGYKSVCQEEKKK